MSEQNSLRIATFNIRYDGHNSPPALSFVESENFISLGMLIVNIVGLQEVLHNQVKDLEVLLGKDWKWTGAGRDDGKYGGEFVPIFYNTRRVELLESKNFWLSKTPDVPSKGWDAGLPHTFTNSTFFFLNTHLDDRGHIAREESAKLILEKYRELLKISSDAVVLTGDFNCKESDEPYRIITGKRETGLKFPILRDTRYEISRPKTTSFGDSYTFTGFSPDVEPVRIDFIFASDNALSNGSVKVLNHGVMSNRYDDGMYISDHRPVIADLALKK
ncbi:3921_t:CDS:2 [Acaulospora colombiana]|uniref:3921_t:CDS:1 n=1 Tax=Acaulospora colombiana TaxID=27376 RepID=A0ACA9L5J8_9GLOM|nr:3921_t:CDS:2 [Acaulospora colombiana]